jgi:hypothetical protein
MMSIGLAATRWLIPEKGNPLIFNITNPPANVTTNCTRANTTRYHTTSRATVKFFFILLIFF